MNSVIHDNLSTSGGRLHGLILLIAVRYNFVDDNNLRRGNCNSEDIFASSCSVDRRKAGFVSFPSVADIENFRQTDDDDDMTIGASFNLMTLTGGWTN